MSLRIIPTTNTTHQTPLALGAPSAPGVHDTLRHNLNLSAPAPKSTAAPNTSSTHPLESRLAAWKSNQDALKMELLRRQFGIAEPVKRGMELAIVKAGEWRPEALAGGFGGIGSAGVHREILEGRDAEVGWEDVFTEGEVGREGLEFHVEMERRMGMEW